MFNVLKSWLSCLISWKIIGQVSQKSKVQHFKKGNDTVLYLHLKDTSGQIKANLFNEEATKFNFMEVYIMYLQLKFF